MAVKLPPQTQPQVLPIAQQTVQKNTQAQNIQPQRQSQSEFQQRQAVQPSALTANAVEPLGDVPTDLLVLWQQLTQKLGLKAFARQLALQSALVEHSAQVWRLRCDKPSLAHNKMALDGLNQAIERYFQAQNQAVPQVIVEVADAGILIQTPQKEQARVREDALQAAKDRVDEHPTIQELVRVFDGMILPHSIRSQALVDVD